MLCLEEPRLSIASSQCVYTLGPGTTCIIVSQFTIAAHFTAVCMGSQQCEMSLEVRKCPC